jgi:hypothetical protein
MDAGLMSAARRLPARRHAIEMLALRDGEFRGICEDLADAEAALLRWQQSSSADRQRRVAEYEGLVDGLTSEIEAALDRAAVISIADRRPRRRGG